MTRAQKKWLNRLNRCGFIQCGGWGDGQKNRPLFALVKMGLAEVGYGPKGSLLQVHGFHSVFYGPYPDNPESQTLSFVVGFLSGK